MRCTKKFVENRTKSGSTVLTLAVAPFWAILWIEVWATPHTVIIGASTLGWKLFYRQAKSSGQVWALCQEIIPGKAFRMDLDLYQSEYGQERD